MNTHYIEGIVRLLELPKQQFVNKSNLVTNVRAQVYNPKTSSTVILTFWGSLIYDLPIIFKNHQYIIVEGLLSIHDKSKFTNFKKMEITVLRAYPVSHQI